MKPSRRDMLKLLLAAPIAATLDVEKLLWIPKPIITVPETHFFIRQPPYAWDAFDLFEVTAIGDTYRQFIPVRSRTSTLEHSR